MGIVGFISKKAGALIGTTASFGKKGAGFGVRGMAAVRDLCLRPINGPAMNAEEESMITSESPAFEQDVEYATALKNSSNIPVAAMKSDTGAVQTDLVEAKSKTKKRQSQFKSQLEDMRAKNESLVSDPKKTKAETVLSIPCKHKATVVPINENVTSSTEVFAARTKDIKVKIADQKPMPPTAEDKVSSHPPVLLEDVRVAVFSNATEKIIFTRAFYDIASQDAAVRTDAARILAGIRHELSARTLAARMACELSPQVRQEYIKALAELKIKEGLPAIKGALTDKDASVRLAAVWGLYLLAGAASAPTLVHMLSDENDNVRRRAVTCIGWLGQEELAVELLSLLKDNSISVFRAAVEAMGNLRSWQVVPALIECLNDPDESIQKIVLGALETITGKKIDKPFPADETSLKCLMARWREWWRDELQK